MTDHNAFVLSAIALFTPCASIARSGSLPPGVTPSCALVVFAVNGNSAKWRFQSVPCSCSRRARSSSDASPVRLYSQSTLTSSSAHR